MTAALARRTLTWGGRTITYELTLERRRDLAITVHPDLRVTVRAPESKRPEFVEARIKAKRAWIVRRLREFETYHPLPVPRRYVSGETHWYLGRQYRLKVQVGPQRVRCTGGRLIVSLPTPQSGMSVRRTLDAWYSQRARSLLAQKLSDVRGRQRSLPETEVKLRVRRMKRRWGSATSSGTITLNTELVRASSSCIEYVIVHELCHLVEPSHSPRFFRMLSRTLPDWERRRARLNAIPM